MPVSSQDIQTSGVGPVAGQGLVYVTYQQNYLGPYLGGNSDIIPGILFLAGNVRYRQDNQGNILAENPNADGSLPV